MHSHGHKTTVFVKMNSYIILEWGRLLTKPHLKGALIRKGRLIGRRVLNRIVTVITVLEAILTGKQSHENIQCFVYGFSFLPTRISQEKLRTNVWKMYSKRPDKFRHRCGPH